MSPLRSSAISALCALILTSPQAGADEKLLVVNATAKGSVELVMVSSGARTQISTEPLHFPRGAVLELGGDLIVTTRDRVLRFPGAMTGQASAGVPITTALQEVDGPSLDPGSGDLYVVGHSRRHRGLFRLRRDFAAPGGFGPPELVGGFSTTPRLVDTKVVDVAGGELSQGDVLVLSRNPAAIFRFVRSGDGFEPTPRLFTGEFPRGARPTGMTFSVGPSGCEILVSDARGAIHRFDDRGGELDPFSDGHRGLRQVTSSVASGKPVVYASLQRGTVLKFTVGQNGMAVGSAEAIPASFHRPDGLGAIVAAPTLAGPDVSVRPAFGLELRFDLVTEPGFTGAELSFVERPVLLSGSGGEDVVLASGNVIPGAVLPPMDGDPRIPLMRIDTTAGFNGTFQLHGDEQVLLGAAGGGTPQLRQQPQLSQPSELVRWMFAPEIREGEPPIAECGSDGCVFTDITTGLGSHVGRGWDFSEYIIARDTRGDHEGQELARIQIKVFFLQGTLNSDRYSSLPEAVRSELKSLVEDYAAAMNPTSPSAGNGPDPARANEILDEFLDAVLAANLPNSPPDNFEGELVARARALKLSTCTFLVTDPEDLNACVGEP